MAPQAQVFRYYLSDVPALVAAGAIGHILTFTAIRKIRIRGWKFHLDIRQFVPTAVGARCYLSEYITRAAAVPGNFDLDYASIEAIPLVNVAGTDYVGLGGLFGTNLERYLSREEADDLGLLLDYGESIRCIGTFTQVAAGVSGAVVSGYFFYEEA